MKIPGDARRSEQRVMASGRTHDLSTFIRERGDEILRDWENAVRALPVARDLDRPALLDHIPHLLRHIADMADELAAGKSPTMAKEIAERHALERLEEGFDLGQVVTEFSLLRDSVLRLWNRDSGASDHVEDARVLHGAIDRAISESVERYTNARNRTLHALDRLSAAALETHDVDAFLHRLIAVLLETTPAVDTVSILLREGDRLVARASVGLEGEVDARFSLRIGEGFAGLVAKERRPRLLRAASVDPLVVSARVRARGLQALYGVPLVEGDHVIGVAHMGSTTARDFSDQDKRLLSALASRATAAIVQYELRDTALRRARQQQAVAGFGQRAMLARDVRTLLDDAVRTLTTALDLEFGLALVVRDDGSFVVEAEHGWGSTAASAIASARDEASQIRAVVERGVAILVEDFQADERLRHASLFAERGIRSGLAIPIHLPGDRARVHAVVSAHARRPRRFEEHVVHFLNAMANAIGSAIALRHSEAHNQKLVDDLRLSESRMRSILEHAPAAIYIKDSLGRCVVGNTQLSEIFERPLDDVLGRRDHELLPQEVADQVRANDAEVYRSGEPQVSEDTIRRADGIHTYLSVKFPIPGPGGEVFLGGISTDITDRKRLEDELQEREARFRVLADNIAQLAWMADGAGSIFWYNQRWFEFTGTTLDEMRGWGWMSVHHPTHRQRVVDKIRRHFESGEPWEDTFPLRGRDGRYRWFLSRAVPMRDADGRVVRWLGTNTDVTEQRFLAEVSARLAESIDLDVTFATIARLAVPTLGDYCFVDLVDGTALRRVAWAHADREQERALGARVVNVVPSLTASANPIVRALATGEPVFLPELERDVSKGFGVTDEHRAVIDALDPRSALFVPMKTRAGTVGVFTFGFTAGTKRHHTLVDKDLAVELARRASVAVENAQLFTGAQDALRARQEILAVVSHDLRNPLGAIAMASAVLLNKQNAQDDPSSRKQLEIIQRAAGRMEHLVRDLLDFSSIRAGRLTVDKRPEDADALVVEILDAHEPLARQKGITVVRSCELHGEQLCCDRDRVMQLFGNLLSNAIKFCKHGDVVTIAGERVDGAARFSIADTGPGIPESELPRVFEPYWSAQRHGTGGTGLGLYIAKGIVDGHGGHLAVESRVGVGTTFSFTLPLLPARERQS